MPDENTAKPIITAGGCLLLPLKLPVTNGGIGGCGSAGVIFADLDDYNSLSVFGTGGGVATTGTLEQDSYGEGTSISHTRALFGLKVGRSDRGKFETDGEGHPWFALRSGSYHELSLGWVKSKNGGGDAFGKDFPGDSDTATLLSFAKEIEGGLEFWPSSEFFIMPRVGIRTLAMHYFGDYAEWQFSPFGIEVLTGVEFGFGAPSHRLREGRGLTPFKIASILGEEVLDLPYNLVMYEAFSEPQASGMGMVGRTYGESGSSYEGGLQLVPALQAVLPTLDAISASKRRLIDAYLDAKADGSVGWRVGFAIIEGVKGIGYTAAGAGGDAGDSVPLASGLTALGNVGTMVLSEAIDEKYLFIPPLLLGGLGIIASNAAGDRSEAGLGLLNAGTLTAAEWSMNPGSNITESTSYTYSPAGYKLLGNSRGMIGMYNERHYLKQSPFFLDFALVSPAVGITNLGNLGVNAAVPPEDESAYKDLGTPSLVASGIGVGLKAGETVYFRGDLSARFVSEYSARGTSGGGGLSGLLALGIKVSEHTDITFGVDGMAYLTGNDRGLTLSPVAGVVFRD